MIHTTSTMSTLTSTEVMGVEWTLEVSAMAAAAEVEEEAALAITEVNIRISNLNLNTMTLSWIESSAGSGNRGFNDRGGNRGGFNDRRGGGNMDRRGGGAGNGGMRDYVDPWAHNGNSGSSPLMGTGGNGGPLSNFTLGNNVMGNMNMGGNNNGGPNSNNGGGNNGGGFANNNMDMDKTSTQVTIPKDVS